MSFVLTVHLRIRLIVFHQQKAEQLEQSFSNTVKFLVALPPTVCCTDLTSCQRQIRVKQINNITEKTFIYFRKMLQSVKITNIAFANNKIHFTDTCDPVGRNIAVIKDIHTDVATLKDQEDGNLEPIVNICISKRKKQSLKREYNILKQKYYIQN